MRQKTQLLQQLLKDRHRHHEALMRRGDPGKTGWPRRSNDLLAMTFPSNRTEIIDCGKKITTAKAPS